jgi:hypothetical protein
MEERRRFERFQLRLPVRMEVIISGKRQVFDLETKDVSAAGVFIETSERFSEGTPVQLSMTLSSDRIRELTGSQSLIKVKGIVVRSAPTGLAVGFAGRREILSLNANAAPPHREDDSDESLHARGT